jgi:hypothetical protein
MMVARPAAEWFVGRFEIDGAGDGTRTRDLLLGSYLRVADNGLARADLNTRKGVGQVKHVFRREFVGHPAGLSVRLR